MRRGSRSHTPSLAAGAAKFRRTPCTGQLDAPLLRPGRQLASQPRDDAPTESSPRIHVAPLASPLFSPARRACTTTWLVAAPISASRPTRQMAPFGDLPLRRRGQRQCHRRGRAPDRRSFGAIATQASGPMRGLLATRGDTSQKPRRPQWATSPSPSGEAGAEGAQVASVGTRHRRTNAGNFPHRPVRRLLPVPFRPRQGAERTRSTCSGSSRLRLPPGPRQQGSAAPAPLRDARLAAPRRAERPPSTEVEVSPRNALPAAETPAVLADRPNAGRSCRLC